MKGQYCRNSKNAMVLDTFQHFINLSLEIHNMIYGRSFARMKILTPPVVQHVFTRFEDCCVDDNGEERSIKPHALLVVQYHGGHRYLCYKGREKYGYGESLVPISLLQEVSKALQTEAKAVSCGVKKYFVTAIDIFLDSRVIDASSERRIHQSIPPFKSFSFQLKMWDHPSDLWICRSNVRARSIRQFSQNEDYS